MPISRYSPPSFNPYGDDEPAQPAGPWLAPTTTTPIEARLSIPGSKSLTNRELVLAALADGESVLRSPLHSRDTALMVEALRALGAGISSTTPLITEQSFGPDLVVRPASQLTGSTTVECGLAGTVMRFVPPLAGLALGPVTFDGDEAARKRPMRTTISSLEALGVPVTAADPARLPFTVHGTGRIERGELEIDASASSQFVSGLLLAAPRFDRGLRLRHRGNRLPSLPHIDMTIAALRARGVRVDTPEPGHWLVAPGPIQAREVNIEPDLSNAAPFLAAALVTGGSVTIDDWPAMTTQVGDDVLGYLEAFGGRVHRRANQVTVSGSGEIRGVALDLSTGGELAPTLITLAALADGPSRFWGIGHIRHHETDRLAALARNIIALGGRAVETEDGIELAGNAADTLHGGPWAVEEDHRLATAGALIGLRVPGVMVSDIAATSKTLPVFGTLWERMVR